MNNLKTSHLQRTIISAAVAATLSIGTTTTHADTYVFSFENGGCYVNGNLDTCTGDGDGLFTMLDPAGVKVQNTSYPYYGDATWGYGIRTQMGGTLTYDTETLEGSMTIGSFDFFNKGAAVASNITFTKEAASDLMLGQLVFDWNGSTINVEIVWDGSGLFAALPDILVSETIDRTSCGAAGPGAVDISGQCATPASNSAAKGSVPIGAVPVATSTFNVNGITNGVGTRSLGTDDAIGGSPMDNGPFSGFNANFDFLGLTLDTFTDTTPPVIALNAHITPAGTASVVLEKNNHTYTEPGATCTDAAPLNTNLDGSVVIGGDTVDESVSAIYTVSYDCTDASTNSTQATRPVLVVEAGAPLVALLGSDPATQECAVAYVDAGATCGDFEDGEIPEGANFVKDQSAVDIAATGLQVDSVSWTCQDITTPSAPVVALRSVNVVDTTNPVITIPTNPYDIVSSTGTNPQTFTDPADAVANDTCDVAGGTIPTATLGTVDMVVPDSGPATVINLLTYSWTDADGNTGSGVRTVNVTRSQPVITLPASILILNVGDFYNEPGMDVADAQDGPAGGVVANGACLGGTSTCVIDSSAVNTAAKGTYPVIYDVTDNDDNIATQQTLMVTVGAFAPASNFTMLDPGGKVFGGTNDVVFDWPEATAVLGGNDTSLNTDVADYANNTKVNMTIASALPHPFFGGIWTAHHTRVFGPGTWSFDSGCTVAEVEATGCPAGSAAASGPAMTMTVAAGQVGAHILFDYNNTNNIDVVNVWDTSGSGVWDQHGDSDPKNQLWGGAAGLAPDPATTWKLVSLDVNGDLINASPMVDGPFAGFYANFNAGPTDTVAPPPPITTNIANSKLEDATLGMFSWGMLLSVPAMLLYLRRRRKC